MSRLRILNDFAFQKSLGEKGDEPQLLAFLNAVLERTGKNNLVSVEILEDKDLPADIVGHKAGKLDVLAQLPDGAKVNIEVQNKNEYNIEKRSLFYWSRKYIEDLSVGADYNELMPVIGINIVNFERGKSTDFHTSYHLWEDRHKDELLTDVCELHFLNMVKFRQAAERDLSNPLNRWLTYFDQNSPEAMIEEVVKMDSAIQLVQKKLDLISLDPEMYRAYEKYEKAEHDYISGINGARREGHSEGRRENQQEIAHSLKAMGMPIEQIVQATRLSEAEIQTL